MFPSFQIGSFTVQMYGVCIVVGFLLACVLVAARAKNFGLPGDTFFLATYALIGGFLGSKILYLFTVLPDIFAAVGNVAFGDFVKQFITSGFVYYGGLIGGALGAYLYIRGVRGQFSKYINIVVPALPLAHAFGRLGCFCAGCCYGIASESPLAMVFPGMVGAHMPVQLFEAIANLLICGVLLLICGKKQRRPVALGVYGILYSVVRFGLEYLRADDIRGFVGGLSTSQFISIFILVFSVALLLFERRIYGFIDRCSTRPGKKDKPAEDEGDGFDAPEETAPSEAEGDGFDAPEETAPSEADPAPEQPSEPSDGDSEQQ